MGEVRRLEGRRVLLVVTGSIAAYKAADLCSKLVQEGAEVKVILTEAAKRFIGEETFFGLTGRRPIVALFGAREDHVDLAMWAELCVVAPATADFLAKMALGLADDVGSATVLALRCPLVVAPAMNPRMFLHPATQENLERLKKRGAKVVGPAVGRTACGEEGPGRMAEPAEILREVVGALSPKGPLSGRVVLITAGPTRERVDLVRCITNYSTGKMGLALAEEARRRGARTVLILGPTELPPPSGVEAIRVETAGEMRREVMRRIKGADVFISAAAVSDYRPARAIRKKVRSGRREWVLRLVPNPDILKEASKGRKPGAVVVGFAAEEGLNVKSALKKLREKGLDLVVATDVAAPDSGFGKETARTALVFKDGRVDKLPLMTKVELARRILDEVEAMLEGGEGS